MAIQPPTPAVAYSNIPIPDPSVLTQKTLRRAISDLKALLEARMQAIENTSLLFRERIPDEIDRRIGYLKALHDQKFSDFADLFNERRLAFRNDLGGQIAAVKEALIAQKETAALQSSCDAEAVAKAEKNTGEIIKGILAQVAANDRAMNEKVNAINDRLNRGEGMQRGTASSQARNYSIIALVIAAAGVSIAYINSQRIREPPPPVVVSSPAPAPQRTGP